MSVGDVSKLATRIDMADDVSGQQAARVARVVYS